MRSALRLALALAVIVWSTLTIADREIESEDFSGWMGEYDSLVFVEEKNAFVFFNEAKRGKYHQVIFESAVIYAPNAEGDTEIAIKSSEYLTAGISEMLERKGLLSAQPGPGVLSLKIAITGVEKSKEDLKVYNFIPVSAVFRTAQAATGMVATYIDSMFEAEMADSITGERVAAVVTKGIEETEKRSGDELEFADVKPTLDKWLAQYDKTLDDYLARR